MDKAQLRQLYLGKRNDIHSHDRLKLDDLMLIQFQRLSFPEDTEILFSFWPMNESSEPNTFLFSGWLRHSIPGMKIAYPKCYFETSTMEAVLIDENTVYQKNKYNINEPVDGQILSPEAVDLVLVPLIVCDEYGHRVGYGKGFYDRFLAKCKPDVIKVGFSYFPPIEKIDNLQQYDLPLDYCVTPETIYEF